MYCNHTSQAIISEFVFNRYLLNTSFFFFNVHFSFCWRRVRKCRDSPRRLLPQANSLTQILTINFLKIANALTESAWDRNNYGQFLYSLNHPQKEYGKNI